MLLNLKQQQHSLLVFLFLEVLVILAMFPVATPSETFLLEEPVAEVALLDHISMVLAAVEIRSCGSWLYHFLAILQMLMIGIVESVDVDGKSSAMLRNDLSMRYEAEVEAGGVVIPHRLFIVCIPVVDKSHSFYRIFCLI